MNEKIYYGDETGRHEAKGKKLEEILQTQADAQELQRLIEAETTAKAQAKESGMAKLRKLGLTDDEIAGLIS
jgi:hypothetical protein